jgi:hypothetical protein
VVAMIAVHHKVAIALRVTVGHAKGHRVAIGRISHGRAKVVSAKGHQVATGRINHGRAKVVSAKARRVATGRISRVRIRVSAKDHSVAIDPTAHKVIVGHAHRAISNNSLVHRVARVSGHLRRHAPRVLAMTSTLCRRHHRLAVR